jgi:hypothetical protein
MAPGKDPPPDFDEKVGGRAEKKLPLYPSFAGRPQLAEFRISVKYG